MALINNPLSQPIFFLDQGTVEYDAGTEIFDLLTTPLTFLSGGVSLVTAAAEGWKLETHVNVDNSGNMVSNAECVLVGAISGGPSGILLTGDIIAFGFADSGPTTDNYDFEFQITGGLLIDSGDYALNDILGININSNNSNFTDFTTDFNGFASGQLGFVRSGPIIPPEPPATVNPTTTTSKFSGRFSGLITYSDNTKQQFAVHTDEKGNTQINNQGESNQAILEVQTSQNWLQDMLALLSDTLVLSPLGTPRKTVTDAVLHFSGRAARADNTWDDFVVQYERKTGIVTQGESVYTELTIQTLTSLFGAIIGEDQVSI